jgi:hypothetical protein
MPGQRFSVRSQYECCISARSKGISLPPTSPLTLACLLLTRFRSSGGIDVGFPETPSDEKGDSSESCLRLLTPFGVAQILAAGQALHKYEQVYRRCTFTRTCSKTQKFAQKLQGVAIASASSNIPVMMSGRTERQNHAAAMSNSTVRTSRIILAV